MKEQLNTLIKSLGGKVRKPQPVDSFMSGAHFYCSHRSESWDGDEDPLGQLKDVSETIRSFDAVTWREHQFFLDDPDQDEWTEVEMTGSSENNEYAGGKERLLLYHIAWEPTFQFIYGLNLLDRSEDPPVYRFDHDGSGEAYPAFRKLSLFLGMLKTKKMLATTTRARVWDEQIDAASDVEDYKTAIALSEQALKQHPNHPHFAANLGLYYYLVGNQRREEACYRQALEIDPNQTEALSNLGNVHARRGEFDTAFELINRAIATDQDDNAEPRYSLACAYALAKQKAKMLVALKQAIKMNEDNRQRAVDEVDFAAFRNDPDFTALVKGEKAPRPRPAPAKTKKKPGRRR